MNISLTMDEQTHKDLRQIAEGWRMLAARVECRPDSNAYPNLVKHVATAIEGRAEELEEYLKTHRPAAPQP